MRDYPEVFRKATGEKLIEGTLNVDVEQEIAIKEDFRIVGAEINEPEQDLLFEKCEVNGVAAYRIRPLSLRTGAGGHGDNILEISSSQLLPNKPGTEVEVTFFR
jgi:CTP-dependent riboflavin kinase